MARVAHVGYLISDLLSRDVAELFTAVSQGFCLSCCRARLGFVATAAAAAAAKPALTTQTSGNLAFNMEKPLIW